MAAAKRKATARAAAPPPPIRVVRVTTKARLPGAIVKFDGKDENDDPVLLCIHTDEDGDLPASPVVPPGTYTVSVLKEGYRSTCGQEPLTVPIPGDQLNEQGKKVYRLASLTEDIDQEQGKAFFVWLIIALVALAVLYVVLHNAMPERAAVATVLQSRTAEVQSAWQDPDEAARRVALPMRIVSLKEAVDEASATGDLRAKLEEVARQVDALSVLVTKAFAGGDDAAAAEAEVPTALRAIVASNADVAALEAAAGVEADAFFWRTGFKRYLEVLFWAFAGILVRLIFTVGGYLRWHCFYRHGVYLHWTLLVAAPLLTLVFVLLISLIKISGDAIAVDFSDPRILAGVSFLLAATPWKLWERLQSAATTIVGAGGRGAGGGNGGEA